MASLYEKMAYQSAVTPSVVTMKASREVNFVTAVCLWTSGERKGKSFYHSSEKTSFCVVDRDRIMAVRNTWYLLWVTAAPFSFIKRPRPTNQE